MMEVFLWLEVKSEKKVKVENQKNQERKRSLSSQLTLLQKLFLARKTKINKGDEHGKGIGFEEISGYAPRGL